MWKMQNHGDSFHELSANQQPLALKHMTTIKQVRKVHLSAFNGFNQPLVIYSRHNDYFMLAHTSHFSKEYVVGFYTDFQLGSKVFLNHESSESE